MNTSFPCWHQQKAGFAGPWEPATLSRLHTGFAGYAHTPANETAELVSLKARIKRDGYDVQTSQFKDHESQWCLYL